MTQIVESTPIASEMNRGKQFSLFLADVGSFKGAIHKGVQ
jgi:hypothetical protein